jgi:crotonobetainyl-CoA:carnitine CoA-transferase CaiB-like acyl-CoA transferase
MPRAIPAVFSGFGSAAVALSGTGIPQRRPLHKTRVIELSTVWAVPTAAMFLSMLGADVIKVESTSRLDPTRRTDRDTTGVAFHLANSGKRSVLADLDTPNGRRRFTGLVRTADVVITNANPALLARNSLQYEDLVPIAQRMVWVNVSTVGSADSLHTRGYAAAFSALSGVSAVNAYPWGRPADLGNAADFRVAYDILLCSLAGLLLARRTGQGGLVDVSCAEAMTLRIGDLIVRSQQRHTTRVPASTGHLVTLAADGSWVACDLERPEDRGTLLRCIGGDANDSAITERLSEWTATRSGPDAAAALRESGLAAMVSMSNIALGRLSHLRERRVIRAVARRRRPVPNELMGAPWHSPANRWNSLNRRADGPMQPGPRLGGGSDVNDDPRTEF